jgi:hypothetical protein
MARQIAHILCTLAAIPLVMVGWLGAVVFLLGAAVCGLAWFIGQAILEEVRGDAPDE